MFVLLGVLLGHVSFFLSFYCMTALSFKKESVLTHKMNKPLTSFAFKQHPGSRDRQALITV